MSHPVSELTLFKITICDLKRFRVANIDGLIYRAESLNTERVFKYATPMTISQLNNTHAIPSHLEFVKGKGNFPLARIDNDKARTTVRIPIINEQINLSEGLIVFAVGLSVASAD